MEENRPLVAASAKLDAKPFSFWAHVAMPILLMVSTPTLSYILSYITTLKPSSLGFFLDVCANKGVVWVANDVLATMLPTAASCLILFVFNAIALVIYYTPGVTKYGPLTPNGVLPEYTDNGIAHCILATLIFIGGSDVGIGLWQLSILYEHFPAIIGTLNIFGLLFCGLLYVKGLYFPSGPDSGSSGYGVVFDYYWGTELYPRICGIDVKKFVNCRFSMTFWQIAGLSFMAASFEFHSALDPGLILCALSQYIYLVKFYIWEIGYLRSIDIIVDRAGFYETWGCLVWVPSVYTLHTRMAVTSRTGLSWQWAAFVFCVGTTSVVCNFWADIQRQHFRETKGRTRIFGQKPVYIVAQYKVINQTTKRSETHTSLLLASGWWGMARHIQYVFELIAAYSWGMLAGVEAHGCLTLFYAVFLTILLVHRAQRDEEKCLAKYGDHYREYMHLVPYKMIPYVY